MSETWLIRLVVSLLSITDNINDDICLELLSPISGELMDESDSFSIITVDVEDGTVVSLANVGSIWRGSCETRVSGETDLIVDENMDCSSPRIRLIFSGNIRAVMRQLLESHGFIDDTLSSKSSISVKQQTHTMVVSLFITTEMLNRPGLSKDNRILGF